MTTLIDLLGGYPGWQDQAESALSTPAVFFPAGAGEDDLARRVCARCPVRRECLEHALEHDERFGIWGGLNKRERDRLRRRR